jgi:hypothetical protein
MKKKDSVLDRHDHHHVSIVVTTIGVATCHA